MSTKNPDVIEDMSNINEVFVNLRSEPSIVNPANTEIS